MDYSCGKKTVWRSLAEEKREEFELREYQSRYFQFDGLGGTKDKLFYLEEVSIFLLNYYQVRCLLEL